DNGPLAFHAEMGVIGFTITVFILGFFMALGKAAVFKHIPVYYPGNVGSVGGLVGMIGGLGGFILPILFGVILDQTGLWTSCFMLLFVIVAVSFVWMHVSILQMERAAEGKTTEELPAFAEFQGLQKAEVKPAKGDSVLTDWRPDDPVFWEEKGRKIAKRNLWLSIP